MRWIVNYFRQVFCKHDFHFEEGLVRRLDEWGDIRYVGMSVYKRCKKCGYESTRDKWDK